jgi:DNA polymerase-3 subunit delta
MEYKELIASVEKKKYVPIYLLMGEKEDVCPYFIDKVSNYIEEHFFEDETDKDFNFQLLYGKETSVEQIIAFSKEYPMMSDYRLVVVREAQEVGKIEQLAEYAKNPQRQTVLVLCYKYKKLDKRTVFYKTIDKTGIVFESKEIYDNQLPAHIKDIAKEKHFTIGDVAVNLLASHIGTDLSRIDNEMEKLRNVIPQNGEITAQIIEEYIGISKEYNIFEFVSAVIARNEFKMYEILNYFSTNPANYEKTRIIPTLYAAFYKLLQYHFSVDKSDNYLKALNVFWKDIPIYRNAASFYSFSKIVKIMHLLRKYDLMSKGVNNSTNTEEQELIKELVFQVFRG